MVWTIFCVVVCAIILIITIWYYIKDNDFEIIPAACGVIFIGFILWMVGMLLGTVILYDIMKPPLKKIYLKEKVYSLDISNGNKISGTFFLGCGGFSSSDGVKYLMFGDNNGGKELLEVFASETIVYEDEDKSPYIIRKAYFEWDFSKNDFWFHHFGDNKWKYLDKSKLHVPKNTIKINPMEIDISKLK